MSSLNKHHINIKQFRQLYIVEHAPNECQKSLQWNILWSHKISTSNFICSVQWSHCTGARFVDGWVDNYRMPKICSCLPCDTKHGTQAQYGHMYSAYSVVMGGEVWSVALGCLGHHTPYIRTYAAAAPQKQRCSLHLSAAAATSYSGTVQWRSTWYSVVHYGTVWYTRAAPPLTYAAAVWPQLSEEQQQLPRSGRLTHIYVSTYLRI